MNDTIRLTTDKLLAALQSEHDAINAYEKLMNLTTNQADKDMIKEIQDDEKKHFNNFAKLYVQMTGSPPYDRLRMDTPIDFNTYSDGLKAALLSELDAYEYYRDILLGNLSQPARNYFYDAMTDENEHAHRFNFIMVADCCYNGIQTEELPSVLHSSMKEDEAKRPTPPQETNRMDTDGFDEPSVPVTAKMSVPESITYHPSTIAASMTADKELKRLRLREAWAQLAYWTRNLIISITNKLPDTKAIVDRLMRVPLDLADVFERYGSAVQAEIQALFTEQSVLLGQLITALRDDNEELALQLDEKTYKNADEIASTLNRINPKAFSVDNWRNLLYEYLDLTKDETMSHLRGMFDQEVLIFDSLEHLAYVMADEMTKSI